SGVVAMSARSAKTVAELATSASARLNALARAHGLTLSRISRDEAAEKDEPATLHSLIEAIMAPYERAGGNGASRAVITGCDVPIADDAITSLALLLHEFATNAAKYGPLCTLDGHIDIDCSEEEANFIITWVERSKPVTNPGAESEGFGTRLTQSAVRQLGGEISREWRPEGLWIRISIPRERLSGAEHSRPI